MTPEAVIATLRDQPAKCALCRYNRDGRLVEPNEIWLKPLGVWMRADGFSIHGDIRHDFRYVYPDAFERIFIRWAVRRWKRRLPEILWMARNAAALRALARALSGLSAAASKTKFSMRGIPFVR